MIDLYTWTTPNGRKVSIMLEETGLAYSAHPVDIGKGEQFNEAFARISPSQMIPAIVDQDEAITLMESGAILIYLAEKTGQFLPMERQARLQTLQWLMFQVGGVGPIFGQAHHFLHFHPDASEYGSQRYAKMTRRLYQVLDQRLGEVEYLNGQDYSIADIATWPWVSRFEWQSIDLDAFENVRRWYLTLSARPAVQRGYDQPHRVNDIPLPRNMTS